MRLEPRGRSDRPRWACGRRFLLALFALVAVDAAANSVDGWIELGVDRRDGTGQAAVVESDSYVQRYNVNFISNPFPNVAARLGGLFERVASTSDVSLDTTTTSIRPLFEIRLRTQQYLAEFRYNRIENGRDASGLPSATDVRESYISTIEWRPVALPRVRLQHVHTNSFDERRTFRDVTEDRFDLISDYEPLPELQFRYRGSLNETSDRIVGSESRDESHNGRVTYSDRWFGNRLSFSSDYNVNRRSTETLAVQGGQVSVPLFALTGLFTTDDTPDEGTLANAPALVDSNIVTGSSINLGLPPVGGDDDPRNIGLAFIRDEPIDALSIWVDRELIPEIAGAFSWAVYTSDDNEEWTLRQGPSPALFDAFENRFDINLTSQLTTRFIKVVTGPLSPDVPFAGDYPTILVTEMQALSDVRGKISATTHLLNANMRTRILNTPSLFHELTYSLNRTGSTPTLYILTNGLSLNHRFNDVYSLSARAAREEGRERDGDRASNVYSASLRAAPLNTLQHRLVFSGRREDTAGRESELNSVFLFSEAQPYRGVNLNVGLGKSYRTRPTSGDVEETRVDASASLVPHRSMTINLTHQDRTSETSGAGTSAPEQTIRTSGASIAYNPLTTLYLFANVQVERRPDRPRRTINNYSFNWAPFPDGALQLSINYNETRRSEDDSLSRIFIPSLRWSINRRSFLQLSYQQLTLFAVAGRSETEIFSGVLRSSF